MQRGIERRAGDRMTTQKRRGCSLAGISIRRLLSRKLLSLLSAVVLLFTCVSPFSLAAAFTANATVTATTANVRSSPGTTATVIGQVVKGDRVLVLEEAVITGDPSGYNSWLKITANSNGTDVIGYVVKSFVLVDATAPDASFESAIAAFPDSYKASLRSLHAAHPSWQFVPAAIPTDWGTVVAEESKIGRSLITSTVNDAWKSTDPAAYNLLTDTFIAYDGTSWVNTTPGVVAYYLDPRNFLNETNIFQFLSLSYDSNTQTSAGVAKMLAGSFMASGTIKDMNGTDVSYADTFIAAASLSGSSPYQLVSRVLQEVSASGSRSTSGTVLGFEGLYNYFNIGASSSSDPVLLGLTFASCGSSVPSKPMSAAGQAKYLIPWNSPYKAILGGANYISSNYIQAGQNTQYFQKFDVKDDGNGLYYHQYMTNIQAMVGESSTLYKAYSKNGLLDSSLTFLIPVYQNMPDATALPAQTGNSNNYLATLAVDGYGITPSFDPTVSSGYSLIVPYPVSSVNVTGSAVSTKASVSGLGNIGLNIGENDLAIQVTAQNGSVQTYTLTIVRQESTGENLYATNYRVNSDNTIAGITPGTSYADFMNQFSLINGGTLAITKATGETISDLTKPVSTGDIITVYNAAGTPVYQYTVLIYGDSNGDGDISVSDLTLICRHILKKSNLTTSYLSASDVNKDGSVSVSDLTLICRHILKKYTITQ